MIIIGLAFSLTIALLLIFDKMIYGFLAVPTNRVDAQVLVVEGWIPDYGIQAAAEEFRQGHYKMIATSGLCFSSDEPSSGSGSLASMTAARLAELGINPKIIIACPTPDTNWNRTSSSARAVREQISKRGITYSGINVVTIGPHARQTWLAYRRIMGPGVRVGIITVPKQGVNTDHWWTSAHGIKMVAKDSAGWLKEVLFGYRH